MTGFARRRIGNACSCACEDIAAIAKRLRVSVGKLERAFKVEFDMGPAEYFRRARMEVHGFLQDGRAAANVTSALLGIARWVRGVIRPPDGPRGREP